MKKLQTIAQLDIPYGNRLKEEALQDMLTHIFTEILPEQGYCERKKQIELASEILHTIAGRHIALAEAEVGTGKTHAYLVAGILAKRGRLNDFWNSGYYPNSHYLGLAHLPIVITTSSIALQTAIVTDYIPELSAILRNAGLIDRPITSVLRKGKEHYICEAYLHNYLSYEKDQQQQNKLLTLLKLGCSVDLAASEGISEYVKRKIGVSGKCSKHCRFSKTCRYHLLMEKTSNPQIDFQVCNHNYFFADILRRASGLPPLIPNYQAVILDEAHKFLQAAQQMVSTSFSSALLPEIISSLEQLHFTPQEAEKIKKLTKKLSGQNRRLFKLVVPTESEDLDVEKSPVIVNLEGERHLRNIALISQVLSKYLLNTKLSLREEGRKTQCLSQLELAEAQAFVLSHPDELVTWLEQMNGQPDGANSTILTCIPKNVNEQLYTHIWSKGLPIILTSGTLSAAGDFTRTKQVLGLDKVRQVVEINKESPFDYRHNVMLYTGSGMPFPDGQSDTYIEAASTEVKKLLQASHGHGAVLFTSYRVMDKVWEQIELCELPYPLFRMNKGGVKALETFRSSGNGVLFASGALWEGVDLPGDILSMLIIVKLPFAVPSPLSEYEQSLYPNLTAYKNSVVVPEMLMKLKQGFGRLIRTETDTGVVAILDSRAAVGGAYRSRVLDALPDCIVTEKLSEVSSYIKTVKAESYFK